MASPAIQFIGQPGSTTPLFAIDLTNPAVDDGLVMQWSKDITFNSLEGDDTIVLTQPMIFDLDINFIIGNLTDGVTYFRLSHNGDWSNTVNNTIVGGNVTTTTYTLITI